MANDRLQIQSEFARSNRQDGIDPESIRPVASPVDEFTTPNAGQQLDQLAHALAPLSADIARYSDVLSQKNEQRDKADAEAAVSAAVRNGAKTYSDAVKSGAIPASASPYYRLYAKRQFGQLAAGMMQSDFQAASERDLANATDLSQFDQYAKQFQQNWLAQHAGDAADDLGFADGFNPHANAAMAAEREQFATTAGKKLQATTAQALAQNQTQLILNGKRAGMTDEQISAQLNAATAQAFASGVSGDVLTEVNSLAVTNAASQLLDHSVLSLAGKVKAGTGALEGTVQWSKERDKALPFILENNSRLNQVEHEQAKEVRDKSVNTTLFNAFDVFTRSADPAHVDLRPFVQQLRAVGASVTDEERLLALQKTAGTRKFDGNEQVFTHAYAEAIDPSGPRITMGDVHGLVVNGQLSYEQASHILTTLQERQKADEAGGETAIPKEPYYKLGLSALKTTFSYIDPSGINKVALSNAMVEFDRRYRELHGSPAWDGGDKPAMTNKIRDDILSSDMMPDVIRQAYIASRKPDFSANKTDASDSTARHKTDYLDDLAKRAFNEQKAGQLTTTTEAALTRAGIANLHDFYVLHHLLPPSPRK